MILNNTGDTVLANSRDDLAQYEAAGWSLVDYGDGHYGAHCPGYGQSETVFNPTEQEKLAMKAANYTRALRAIKARIDGVFDDPDLVSFGPLAFWPNEDITRIVNSVLEDGNATRETT